MFNCERGVAEVTGPFDHLERLIWALREGGPADVHEAYSPDADPFLYGLEHVLDCLRNRADPRADGAAGLQAVRFRLAVKQSARTGTPVVLQDA